MDYGLQGKVAVVTGGGGAICGEIATALANEGVSVAIWDVSRAAADRAAEKIRAMGGSALAIECDATDPDSVGAANEAVLTEYGAIDILVNGAGGSRRECTTSDELEFFDIDVRALTDTMRLNWLSAVVPSQAVGRIFAAKRSGVILNISSIAGICPLTRAVGYSNGKAALNSFTQWLAVHMAHNYAPEIRVNAVAPGFILTDQNRFLLLDQKTGKTTQRGRHVLANVPMARYAQPGEVVGAALWLVSDSAGFVTGAVVPVDGGFTAYSGV